MTKILLTLIISLIAIQSFAQTDKKLNNNVALGNINVVPYRLFPTQNVRTFLKLNTRNGQMWQVQIGTDSANRFVTNLNPQSLTSLEKEANDRFTLYATQSTYIFILVDQLDGRIWQVQWSTKPDNR